MLKLKSLTILLLSLSFGCGTFTGNKSKKSQEDESSTRIGNPLDLPEMKPNLNEYNKDKRQEKMKEYILSFIEKYGDDIEVKYTREFYHTDDYFFEEPEYQYFMDLVKGDFEVSLVFRIKKYTRDLQTQVTINRNSKSYFDYHYIPELEKFNENMGNIGATFFHFVSRPYN